MEGGMIPCVIAAQQTTLRAAQTTTQPHAPTTTPPWIFPIQPLHSPLPCTPPRQLSTWYQSSSMHTISLLLLLLALLVSLSSCHNRLVSPTPWSPTPIKSPPCGGGVSLTAPQAYWHVGSLVCLSSYLFLLFFPSPFPSSFPFPIPIPFHFILYTFYLSPFTYTFTFSLFFPFLQPLLVIHFKTTTFPIV